MAAGPSFGDQLPRYLNCVCAVTEYGEHEDVCFASDPHDEGLQNAVLTHIATANPSTVLEMVSAIRHMREQRDELHSALKGLLSYFQSGNSVPVDKATIKADSVEVKAAQLALSKVADKL